MPTPRRPQRVAEDVTEEVTEIAEAAAAPAEGADDAATRSSSLIRTNGAP